MKLLYNEEEFCYLKTEFLNFMLTQPLAKWDVIGAKLESDELKLDTHLPNKIDLFYFNESRLEMMKNAFYIILKALFIPKIFEFLSWLFWSCMKMAC